MCNEHGGQCSGCMGADPDATAGYCCSGVNHHGGGGPAANGDCPADAIAAVSTDVHSCVVKKKGLLLDSRKMAYGRGYPLNRQNSPSSANGQSNLNFELTIIPIWN